MSLSVSYGWGGGGGRMEGLGRLVPCMGLRCLHSATRSAPWRLHYTTPLQPLLYPLLPPDMICGRIASTFGAQWNRGSGRRPGVERCTPSPLSCNQRCTFHSVMFIRFRQGGSYMSISEKKRTRMFEGGKDGATRWWTGKGWLALQGRHRCPPAPAARGDTTHLHRRPATVGKRSAAVFTGRRHEAKLPHWQAALARKSLHTSNRQVPTGAQTRRPCTPHTPLPILVLHFSRE